MISASQLRAGMAIRFDGQVYKVLEAGFKAGGGQAGGVEKTRLENLVTSRLLDHNFRPDERLEELQLDTKRMEFLYSDSDNYVFMDPHSFEQLGIPAAVVGPAAGFLRSGMEVPVQFFEGRALSIVFPDTVEAQVADTAPPIHSGQDNTWKEATLDNGEKISVPLFVGPGETVRMDVRTGRYLERVRVERKRGA
jgi:elongation factor P